METRFGETLCLVVLTAACSTSEPISIQLPLMEHQPVVIEGQRVVTERHRDPGFLGVPDGATRYALHHEKIVAVKRGTGGRSLAFRVTFEDGSDAYFKPEQTFSAARWYSEVAAYYLDRELGFGRVPPVIGRRVRWAQLERAAGSDSRVSELTISEDGNLRGALINWIDGGLTPIATLGVGWERWIRVDGPVRISPYQRPQYYGRRQGGMARELLPIGQQKEASEVPAVAAHRAALSDLIVFDFLIQNADRWGGEYTNVRVDRHNRLVFLDNAAGFPQHISTSLHDARLTTCQRFSKKTYQALKAFDVRAFESRLHRDPLAPVLGREQLHALGERVHIVVEHIEKMIADHGASKVFF